MPDTPGGPPPKKRRKKSHNSKESSDNSHLSPFHPNHPTNTSNSNISFNNAPPPHPQYQDNHNNSNNSTSKSHHRNNTNNNSNNSNSASSHHSNTNHNSSRSSTRHSSTSDPPPTITLNGIIYSIDKEEFKAVQRYRTAFCQTVTSIRQLISEYDDDDRDINWRFVKDRLDYIHSIQGNCLLQSIDATALSVKDSPWFWEPAFEDAILKQWPGFPHVKMRLEAAIRSDGDAELAKQLALFEQQQQQPSTDPSSSPTSPSQSISSNSNTSATTSPSAPPSAAAIPNANANNGSLSPLQGQQPNIGHSATSNAHSNSIASMFQGGNHQLMNSLTYPSYQSSAHDHSMSQSNGRILRRDEQKQPFPVSDPFPSSINQLYQVC